MLLIAFKRPIQTYPLKATKTNLNWNIRVVIQLWLRLHLIGNQDLYGIKNNVYYPNIKYNLYCIIIKKTFLECRHLSAIAFAEISSTQTRSHLASCPACPDTCSREDLMAAIDNVVKVSAFCSTKILSHRN